jgi:hypothetical protein
VQELHFERIDALEEVVEVALKGIETPILELEVAVVLDNEIMEEADIDVMELDEEVELELQEVMHRVEKLETEEMEYSQI